MDAEAVEEPSKDVLSLQKEPNREEYQQGDDVVVGATGAHANNYGVEDPPGGENHGFVTASVFLKLLGGDDLPVDSGHDHVEYDEHKLAGKRMNQVINKY